MSANNYSGIIGFANDWRPLIVQIWYWLSCRGGFGDTENQVAGGMGVPE